MVWYNAENVLLFLKQEPAVAHLAATYLRWALFGLPGTTIFRFCRAVAVITPSVC